MRLLFALFLIAISGCDSGNKSEAVGPKPEGGATPPGGRTQSPPGPNNRGPVLPIVPIAPARAAYTSTSTRSTGPTSASVPSGGNGGGGAAPKSTPPAASQAAEQEKVQAEKDKVEKAQAEKNKAMAEMIKLEEQSKLKGYSDIKLGEILPYQLFSTIISFAQYLGNGPHNEKLHEAFETLFWKYSNGLIISNSISNIWKEFNPLVSESKSIRPGEWKVKGHAISMIESSKPSTSSDPFSAEEVLRLQSIDTGNGTAIPLMLRVLAEQLADKPLFSFNGLALTPFQQLLVFETKDAKTSELKDKMIALLIGDRLWSLELDKPGTVPFPFARTTKVLEKLIEALPSLGMDTVCKEIDGVKLSLLECALMADAPDSVIKKLIEKGAKINESALSADLKTAYQKYKARNP